MRAGGRAKPWGRCWPRGLHAAPDSAFRVYSDVRPWTGTFADVELVARRLAAGLRARGVGPGDVVALQLPNWMEAAAAFWAAAFLGAAIVPIVHFYGRKEVAHIFATAKPQVFITAEEFGRLTYQPDLCSDVEIVGRGSGATSTACSPTSPCPARSPPILRRPR